MIKPILLIPERHWDALAKEALLEALPMLHRYGYDTYCIEMPSNYTTEDMKASVDSTIKVSDRILTIKSPVLARQVACLDRRLFTAKQFHAFVEELEQFLKPKLAKFYTAVPDHLSTQKLEKSIGVKLVAKQRPSFFVDCMHVIEEGEDESMLVSKISHLGNFLNGCFN